MINLIRNKEKKSLIVFFIIELCIFSIALNDYFFQIIDRMLYMFGKIDYTVSIVKCNIIFVSVIIVFLYTIYLHYKVNLDFEYILIFTVWTSFVVLNISTIIDPNYTGLNNNWDFSDLTFAPVSNQTVSMIETYAQADFYGTNYPPIAVAIMKFLGLFYSNDKRLFVGNYLTTIIILATSVIIFCITTKLLDNKNNKNIIAATYLFTGPMLFEYQRLNITIFAFILLWIFIATLEADERWKQIVGIICLILAANIKLFPAIFGILLIKRKRFKDAILCILGGIGFFLAPLLVIRLTELLNGIDSKGEEIINYAKGVNTFVNSNSGTSVSIQDIVTRISWNFDSSYSGIFGIIGLILTLITLVVGLGIVMKAKNYYQELLVLVMLCILVPSISYWYSLIYILIPLTECIKNGCNNKMIKVEFLIITLLMISTYHNYFFISHGYIRLIVLWILIVTHVIIENNMKTQLVKNN